MECSGELAFPWEPPFGPLVSALYPTGSLDAVGQVDDLEDDQGGLTAVLACQEGGTPKRGG